MILFQGETFHTGQFLLKKATMYSLQAKPGSSVKLLGLQVCLSKGIIGGQRFTRAEQSLKIPSISRIF